MQGQAVLVTDLANSGSPEEKVLRRAFRWLETRKAKALAIGPDKETARQAHRIADNDLAESIEKYEKSVAAI